MRTQSLNASVLFISDDLEMCQVWAYSLKQRGLEAMIVGSAGEAMACWTKNAFDLVIINVYTSRLDGITLCRQLRTELANPILLFLSTHDEAQILLAYEAGVDECVVKPVGVRLFLAKVMAWLRRSWTVPTKVLTKIQSGDLQLDPVRRQIVIGSGMVVELTNLEFRLLYLLMSHQGQVLETNTIIDRVWGYTTHGDSVAVKNVVYRLRRKIESDPHQPRHILTVAGVGYTFQPD